MTHLSRRALLAGIAGASATAALGGCGTEKTGGRTAPIRVGYIGDFNGTSVVAVATEKKLWARHGLAPETKVFTNGPLQVQALGAGDLEIGYVGPGALWLPATGKAKVIAINSLGFADRVIAQPGIDTMAKLKGKKVGVPEGTSGDMILRLALEQAGMTIDDVQKVTMDPSTVVTAFGSGQVAAAGIWYPLVDTIKKKVADLVELAKTEDFYPEVSFPSAFIASNEFVSRKADVLTKALRAIQDANDYRANHVAETVEITAEFLKVPAGQLQAEAANVRFLSSADLAGKTSDGTVATWLTGMNKLFVGFGKLTGDVDPRTYYAADAYLAAAKRG